MNTLKALSAIASRDALHASSALLKHQTRTCASIRSVQKNKDVDTTEHEYPRKVFSGIQPTGALHLGNYLGAVQNWTRLQNAKEDVTFCIVDMHSMTIPQEPVALRENIFQMAAAMLACGIDPEKSTLFVQSAVKEHAELSWILGCMTTMARLSHLPQYKEKTRAVKEIPLGLFVYPVLQAADIMLYKATHVPVGEDQLQHIQLTQHLARTFNNKYGDTFPICHAVISDKSAARIRSLRDPSKKMSKSDGDPKAVINLTDDADVIIEKVKKAVTDFCSDVHYNPETRQGVSNLISIHSLLSGKNVQQICEEAKSIDTGKYKMRVAEEIVEHLRPIRNKINQQLVRRNELMYLLEMGADKARETAAATLAEVKQKLGLGACAIMPTLLEHKEEVKMAAKPKKPAVETKKIGDVEVPLVPKQQLRVEKKKQMRVEIKTNVDMDLAVPPKLDVKPVVSSNKTAAVESSAPVTTKALVPRKMTVTPLDSNESKMDKQQKEIKI
ncbi:tryptophan--tRNA ligase, mitochondrial [Anastrepha obliqua]|uniref:tryptophan--tRNA ligase, mitochondrial n=1 Tax=Anastrepha obliqua TaxID=95512 RepID=UPI002409758F|nr:tryptophan--tRNA ligase, mitochondrial [Anastrepha obliqua]